MSTERLEEFFTPWRAVQVEGARIGLTTCLVCGATVAIDPDDTPPAERVHLEYHRKRGELDTTESAA